MEHVCRVRTYLCITCWGVDTIEPATFYKLLVRASYPLLQIFQGIPIIFFQTTYLEPFPSYDVFYVGNLAECGT